MCLQLVMDCCAYCSVIGHHIVPQTKQINPESCSCNTQNKSTASVQPRAAKEIQFEASNPQGLVTGVP